MVKDYGVKVSLLSNYLYLLSLTSWWFQIFFCFHPYLGKWSNLTSIFFKGVGSTTNQLSAKQPPTVMFLSAMDLHHGWTELTWTERRGTEYRAEFRVVSVFQGIQGHSLQSHHVPQGIWFEHKGWSLFANGICWWKYLFLNHSCWFAEILGTCPNSCRPTKTRAILRARRVLSGFCWFCDFLNVAWCAYCLRARSVWWGLKVLSSITMRETLKYIYVQRKFRSQPSDNMDRWKAEKRKS